MPSATYGRRVQRVIVLDRIAANGDVAGKIGTYVAAATRANGVPFYVAATIDDTLGGDIPIEAQRNRSTSRLVDDGRTMRTPPRRKSRPQPGIRCHARAWIAGIITEKGIVRPSVEGIGAVARR